MNHYEVLGVDAKAAPEEIKQAYRVKSRDNHPDRHGPGKTEAFAAITAAYAILSDPAKRAEYDATGSFDAGRADRMRDMLCRLLFQCLQEAEDAGTEQALFDAMWTHMREERNNGAARCEELKRLILKRKTLAARITRKGGGTNLFATVVLNDVAVREKELASVTQAIKDIDEMCITIREYQLTPDGSDILAEAYLKMSRGWLKNP